MLRACLSTAAQQLLGVRERIGSPGQSNSSRLGLHLQQEWATWGESASHPKMGSRAAGTASFAGQGSRTLGS